MALPDKERQIAQVHAVLINKVVEVYHDPTKRHELDPALEASEANGWTALVAAIREILTGRRDEQVLSDLDEEDRVIVAAILQGLQDPSTLPDPQAQGDAAQASPGLAHLVHQAGRGDTEALRMLGEMAEQMRQTGGDMARVGAVLRRLVNGERDPDALTEGMEAQGRALIVSVLEELARLQAH